MDADWTRPLVDADAFQHEQACLAHAWTFLGLTADVPNDGDWFTATIATRSVFVQRFGSELRGFENLCAHRFYPLRHGLRGNGPVICGYHHWQYDSEGRAVGIPHGRDLFGAIPQELGARLTRLELAVCGSLIFGRFANGTGEGLREFLGDGFEILEAASRVRDHCQFISDEVAASWRLCMHISLDDYHAPAVHPSTFGRNGYLKRTDIGYFRFGLHSAFLHTPRPDAFDTMRAECRTGTHRPTCYTIFQVVPNVLLATFMAHRHAWYTVVQGFEPLRHDTCRFRAWLFPTAFVLPAAWLRRLTEPVRAPFVRHYVQRVFREDNRICERLQDAAPAVRAQPRLGMLEERIEWFEESLRRLIAEGEAVMAAATGERHGAGGTSN